MIKRIKSFVVLPIVVGFCWCSAVAQRETNDLRNRYQYIEVSPFDVKPGIDFPDEYRERMMADVVEDLRGLKGFQGVIVEGETRPDASAPTIQLIGTIIKYKRGSRGKRFFALGLAGDTNIVAHVKFLDRATGKLLLEADVDGLIHHGFLGGSSKGAPSGVGKDVAKIAKRVFF